MTSQIIPFISNHPQLCGALLAVVGLMILNEYWIARTSAKGLSCQETVHAMNHQQATVIDMREQRLFQAGHITKSKNLHNASAKTLSRYQNKPLILVCTRGTQSMQLANQLKKSGFVQSLYLTGGLTAWKAENLPLTTGKK